MHCKGKAPFSNYEISARLADREPGRRLLPTVWRLFISGDGVTGLSGHLVGAVLPNKEEVGHGGLDQEDGGDAEGELAVLGFVAEEVHA